MPTKAQYAARREAWLQALESGEYKQTREYLHSTKGFCCLGVACDLFKRNLSLKVTEEPSTLLGEENMTITSYNTLSGVLPGKVMNYLGLNSTAGGFRTEDGYSEVTVKVKRGPCRGDEFTAVNLVDLNDEALFSFKDIAKFIRTNPHVVFVKGTY